MNTQLIVLLAGRDRSCAEFMQKRLPLGAKVPLVELKDAYSRRFNCNLMEVPADEKLAQIEGLPICTYDGRTVQRIAAYKERF